MKKTNPQEVVYFLAFMASALVFCAMGLFIVMMIG